MKRANLFRELAFYLLLIAGAALWAGPFERPTGVPTAPGVLKVSDMSFETTGVTVTSVNLRLSAPAKRASVTILGQRYGCVVVGTRARCATKVSAEALTSVSVAASS